MVVRQQHVLVTEMAGSIAVDECRTPSMILQDRNEWPSIFKTL